MGAKTKFSKEIIEDLLLPYNMGRLVSFKAIPQGTVQSNYLVVTSAGKFILRYYENRSYNSVLFESELLSFLTSNNYPCPHIIKDRKDNYVGSFQDKPYALFKFIEGHPVEILSPAQMEQTIHKVAELQILTQNFHSVYQDSRWNYNVQLCRDLATSTAQDINTIDAYNKLSWIEQQLSVLVFPDDLPKGICHCDFHYSNILFHGDHLVGLIDFDDANHTFLSFDLVCLVDSWAWLYPSETLDFQVANTIIQEYETIRPLSLIEKHHFLDIYILSVLFDSIWFFNRGSVGSFYEQKKIEYLASLGRFYLEKNLFT